MAAAASHVGRCGARLPELNATGYIVLMLRQDPADALPHDREAIARYIGRRERD